MFAVLSRQLLENEILIRQTKLQKLVDLEISSKQGQKEGKLGRYE